MYAIENIKFMYAMAVKSSGAARRREKRDAESLTSTCKEAIIKVHDAPTSKGVGPRNRKAE
jgi:hypothetical protein